jgi:hypothetical protein
LTRAIRSAADEETDDEGDGDGLPTAAEAVARCAGTFDPTDTGRIPNGTGRWNAYAGSCHGGE